MRRSLSLSPILQEEGNKDQDGKAHSYRAILEESDPIEFFNE